MKNPATIIAVYDDQAFASQIIYTFNFILSVFGVDYKILKLQEFTREHYDPVGTLIISYGKECINTVSLVHIHIYSSDFFGDNYLKPASMPRQPLPCYESLPVIYASNKELGGWVLSAGDTIQTTIDIIASSFFMVSRYEEVIIDTFDKHERFPATASLAYREGFLDRPIVNEYIELLWKWIKELYPDIQRKALWPDGKKFAVCLTHDVDVMRKYSLIPPVIKIGATLIKQKNIIKAFKIGLEYLACLLRIKRDPYDTFNWLTKLETGFSSTFFFMAGGNNKYDTGCTIKNTRAQKLAKRLKKQGFEIGLHASYNSYGSEIIMLEEKQVFNKVLGNTESGCRQHYLRWKTPHTWRAQEKAGIIYDATLTYADHAGFRCGICLPFKPFDILDNRVLNIWEIPLTVMDGSLQNLAYQNLTPDEGYEVICNLIDRVKKVNGVFVLLWHNSAFDPDSGWSGWGKVYNRTLLKTKNEEAFTSGCAGILNHFCSR